MGAQLPQPPKQGSSSAGWAPWYLSGRLTVGKAKGRKSYGLISSPSASYKTPPLTLKKIEVQLTYNTVLVSDTQHSDSVTYVKATEHSSPRCMLQIPSQGARLSTISSPVGTPRHSEACRLLLTPRSMASSTQGHLRAAPSGGHHQIGAGKGCGFAWPGAKISEYPRLIRMAEGEPRTSWYKGHPHKAKDGKATAPGRAAPPTLRQLMLTHTSGPGMFPAGAREGRCHQALHS